MNKKLWRWTLLILWMALIFFFSSQTAEQSTALSDPFSDAAGRLYQWIRTLFATLPEAGVREIVFFTRKAAHAFLYFVLALLTLFSVSGHTKKRLPLYGGTFLICALYAVSDEFHQSFLPGRAMRLSDVINDALSSLVAIGLWALIWHIRRRKREKKKTLE